MCNIRERELFLLSGGGKSLLQLNTTVAAQNDIDKHTGGGVVSVQRNILC